MGNYYCCQELPCASHDKGSTFRRKLRKTLKENEFKEACLRVAQRHYDSTLELENQEILRRSITAFSHYETSALNPSINEEIQISQHISHHTNQPSSHIASEQQHREHYLLKLIMESYLFLDFSDAIDNHQTFDRLMRHELMNGDPSLDGSFIANNRAIVSNIEFQLINFNPEMVGKLQNYVRFCRKVKHDFTPDRQRFLSKLNLALQSEIIQKYLTKEFRKNTHTLLEMFEDIQAILNVLMVTVQTMYDFQLEEKESIQYGEQFFNAVNIYTMITSILFESQDFTSFIINKIKQCFRHRFNLYLSQPQYSNSEFINDYISLNSRESRRQSRISMTNLENLVSNNCSRFRNIPIFTRSRKMLDKIFKKPVPLFKLKIIYELYQQISRQISELRQILSEKFEIEVSNVFNRQTELLAFKWLLKASSSKVDDIASNLLFTYQFVHQRHLIDKKGSRLTTCMQQVQKMLKWPTSS